MKRLSEARTEMPADPLGAFCRNNHVALKGASDGLLAGLSFAAKDVFDIAGTRTGYGHPTWLETHPPAETTAEAVRLVLGAGAKLVGRTISDELCYSLSGENFHFGTPINPKAPDHIPGGSSSGSAAAVAGGLADFALGTDCGGSVRVPASYCGIFGMRPTHSRVSLDGVFPFAKSFDCAGWFARDPDVLMRVGRVLLGERTPPSPFHRLLVAEDAFGRADAAVREAFAPAIAALERSVGRAHRITLSRSGLETWFETFRVIQASEIWHSFGKWVETEQPRFGPGVQERFEIAASITEEQAAEARSRRREIIGEIEAAIMPGDVVCLPTTPRAAPLRGSHLTEVEVVQRQQAMALLCTAGLGGLPQISLPVADVAGAPVGLSIIARRGADIDLLGLAADICDPTTPTRFS
ncbi:MAG TPA: amidase [Dongiaceae bacterium]|nr:amidase [Dongiaceae bacterium]